MLIEVEDVPDELPSFNPGVSIWDLDENTEVNESLFQIEAVDGDYANPMAVNYCVRQIFNGCENRV